MKKLNLGFILFFSILSFIFINCEGIRKGTVVPIDTLVGKVVLKGDTSDPNYRTHYFPGNFRIDPEGNLWISDIGGMRLLKYNSEGEYQYQILFYPKTATISKKSPNIDFGKMGCGLLPVFIRDFSFDCNGNLYVFLTKENLESGSIKHELLVMKKDGTISIYDLDNIIFYSAIDSKKRIYASRMSVGPPLYSDSSIITVTDSLGNKLETIGSPIIKPDWDLNEAAHFNRVFPAVDKNDNLWVAFLCQPIVRKYDSHHKLIWERKYLTTEIKQVLTKTDSARKERIARKKKEKKRIPHPFFFIFRGIAPLSNGGALLFTNKGVVYELNEKGKICRKIFLKRSEVHGVKFYSVDKKGYIYENILMGAPQTKIVQTKIYKFSEQREKGGEMKKLNLGFILFFSILSFVSAQGDTHKEITIPTDTLVGKVILKCDTANPNYYISRIAPVGRIQIDSSINVWISDIRNVRLLKYDAKGGYLSEINFAPVDSLGKPIIYKGGCYVGPNQIWDFCIGKDRKLYVTFRVKERSRSRAMIRSFNLEGEKLNEVEVAEEVFLLLKIAVDSKGLIYVFYLLHSAQQQPLGDSLVRVYDSTGRKLDFLVAPLDPSPDLVALPPQEPRRKLGYNEFFLSIDDEDNLWIAYKILPIVRKYNSAHQLVFEREYMTAETRKSLIRTKELQKEEPWATYPTFRDIIALNKDSVFLLTPWNVVYRLDENGDIQKK